MICKNCSKEFDGKFCPDCGTAAEQEPVLEETNQAVEQTEQEIVAQPEAQEAVAQQTEAPTEAAYTPAPVESESYYEPATNYGEVYAEPKKKGKKKGIIIISIILVVLIAAFCVVSFTDLVFTKKAQFGAVLKNMGSDCDVAFDTIEAENIETKYSIKLNGNNKLLDELGTEGKEEGVDFINSISLSLKQSVGGNESKAILAAYEGDIKLFDAQALMTNDAVYGKVGFSDLVFKAPLPYDLTGSRAKAEQIKEIITKEIKAAVESGEFEKGIYKGYFDLDKDIKTITFDLDDDEATVLLRNIIKDSADVLGIDIGTMVDGDSGIDEVTVSALYTGAFSYARKALGVSVIIEAEGEEIELLYFSNKENKAVYGISSNDIELILTDNFVINGDTQSGTITFGGFTGEELEGLSVTYTRKHNYIEVKTSIVEGADILDIKYTAESDGQTVDVSVKFDTNSEELLTVNMATAPCDAFDVDIDTSKAIDITGSFDEDEVLEQLENDFMAWIESNDEGVVFEMLNELIAVDEESPLEQYMMDEFGIEHTQTDFESANRGSYVMEIATMVDVQEFGYEDDVIKEMTETLYMDVSDYTYAQQKQVLNTMRDNFADAEDVDNCIVTNEIVGDYVVTTLMLWDMDDPESLKAFREAGLVGSNAGGAGEILYFEESVAAMVVAGYVEVE